ncbi:hypothetical protein EON65_16275 [archaeon]|nr:MAG: hypothetical protein EON65_16275 [archaeon]
MSILASLIVQADEIDQANSLLSPTTQSHTTPSTSMSVGGIMDCQVDYTDVTARSSDIPFGSSVYRTGTRTSASGSPMDLVSMTSRSASIVHRGHDGDVMLMDNMRVNPENIMEMEDLWRMSKEETEIHIHHSSDDRVGEDKGEEKSKRSKKN